MHSLVPKLVFLMQFHNRSETLFGQTSGEHINNIKKCCTCLKTMILYKDTFKNSYSSWKVSLPHFSRKMMIN